MMENRFTKILKNSGMNQTEFSKYFNIPYRTLTGWKNGERSCPEYLLDLMVYKLKKENETKHELAE